MNPRSISAQTETEQNVLTVVAALSCEIKPIVDSLRLQKVCDKPFTVFRGELNSQLIEVLVSGIGALSMAAAVGWMGGQRPQLRRVWLNCGSAGHGSASPGSAYRVHASACILTERKHYPSMVAKANLATDQVLSVDAPSGDYPESGGIDMEAFAFFTAAYKFSSNELVESVKVVSDNPEHNLADLTAAKISALMAPHVEQILSLGSALLALLPPTINPAEIEVPELRATHSQKQQVNGVIAKLSALDAVDDELRSLVNRCESTKDLLAVLSTALLSVEPNINVV